MMTLVSVGAALAQPAGDPVPGSTAPLVAIVTPMDGGVVGARVRVQARVQHPSGLAEIAAVSLSVTGATTASAALSQNASYVLPGGAGIYEAALDLLPGSATLVATATDRAGASTLSSAVSVVANEGRGDGNLLVREGSSQLCGACHALRDHGSEVTGRALYGAWTTTCRDCHATHGTRNISLVRETIRPPWLAGGAPPQPRAVRFATRVGHAATGGVASPTRASYANGDGSGPCQVCHTRTARWRSGGAAEAIHLGTCGFCHGHEKAFKARCDDCHASVPPATGAHAAHAGPSSPAPSFPSDPRLLGCGTCHPTDPALHGDGSPQVVLNPLLVLPGGTRTAGASLSGPVTSPSCRVGCHNPLGAPPPAQPVAWSAAGPLPCTSCHVMIDPSGASTSRHEPIFSEARPASGEPTTCWSCHAVGSHDASHLTGAPALVETAAMNAACVACHSPPSGPSAGPQGQVLHRGGDAASSRTPMRLPGWSPVTLDTAAGDFHGGRRGAGYGGTLRAPYYRGYPAMPCTDCHAGHASGNPFLLAARVNGTPIPAGAIQRDGVGAERLCAACHTGENHAGCLDCHGSDPRPIGTPCLTCHGHEGIRRFPPPYIPYGPHDEPAGDRDCSHCHSWGWALGPDSTPPSFNPYGSGAQVSGITATSARIGWGTNEPATTWVEYGVGTPGYVAGDEAEVMSHTVTLTGLAPSTTYVWRIRSVDASRNAVRTGIEAFTTWSANAVPAPDLAPVYAGAPVGTTTTTARLLWYSVTAPSGTPVEYEVQLASDAAFTYLQDATLAITDPSLLTGNSGWISGVPDGGKLGFDVTLTNLPQDDCSPVQPVNVYSFRVRARDALGTVSAWSSTGSFGAGAGDPLCG